eukprot:m.309607 g.309607  ORF g.309607 m.309607 type:complete len:274 (+) comp47071_c0_seq1:273-1094(+)
MFCTSASAMAAAIPRMLLPWLLRSRDIIRLGRQTRRLLHFAARTEPSQVSFVPSYIRSANMSMVSTSGVVYSRGSGQIQLILGPMFSGKTTELLRRIKRYAIANHSCVMIKYDKDKRYAENNISTHDKQVRSALSCARLFDLKSQVLKYEVVGIDEAQFFPDIVDFCEELADSGRTVIVAALDGTFQRKPFGSILDIIPLAESVVKLSAVCMNCFQDASFSKRLTAETQIEVIGGSDKYMAVCRECYKQSTMNVTPTKPNQSLEGRRLFPEED